MTCRLQVCKVSAMKHALWITFAACLTLQPGFAQDEAAEGDQESLYQVELLIFRHLDQSRTTSEIPQSVTAEITELLDQQLPRLSAGDNFASGTDQDAAATEEQVWRPVRGERFMAADAQRLERLQAYGLISHLAWIQPAPDVSVAIELDANSLGAAAEVSGHVKLYRKRYLHLAVDLALVESAVVQSPLFARAEAAPPAIVDSRRVRLGRTVYFDQPDFGVLAVINRLESD